MTYFKKWPKKEDPTVDPNELSDVAWRRRELMCATDPSAYEPGPVEKEIDVNIDWDDVTDCPF